MRIIVTTLGSLLVASGIIGGAMAVTSRSAAQHGWVLGLAIAMGFVVTGVVVLRAGRRLRDESPGPEPAGAVPGPSLEGRILLSAARHDGLLTAEQAAAEGGMTLEQARDELERLAAESLCQRKLTAQGTVFSFPRPIQ